MSVLGQMGDFWKKYPALLYGLSFTLGACFSLLPFYYLFLPSIVIWGPFLPSFFFRNRYLFNQLLLSLCVAGCGLIYTNSQTPDYRIPESGIHGVCELSIHQIHLVQTSTGTRWKIKGTLEHFLSDEGKALTSLPVHLTLTASNAAFAPNTPSRWKISGTLFQTLNEAYRFKPDPKSPWESLLPHVETYIAAARQWTQKAIAEYIQHHMHSERSGPFLTAMITGHFDDTIMRHHFSRFGLQHILAISGFHFSLIACILSILFQVFLPRTSAIIALLISLTIYYLILGNSPSVIRSWMTITLAWLGYLLHERSSGLNLLGLALLITVAISPESVKQIGFQFSFAITASLLLFYSPFERCLQIAFPTRRLHHVIEWGNFEQHAYIASIYLRNILALTLAVNLTAIPLIGHHFQSMPLFSFLYNLFFPLFVTASMILLSLGTILHACIGFAGTWIHTINNSFTHFAVGLAVDAPPAFDHIVIIPPTSPVVIISLITMIFVSGCYLHLRRCKDSEEWVYY